MVAIRVVTIATIDPHRVSLWWTYDYQYRRKTTAHADTVHCVDNGEELVVTRTWL